MQCGKMMSPDQQDAVGVSAFVFVSNCQSGSHHASKIPDPYNLVKLNLENIVHAVSLSLFDGYLMAIFRGKSRTTPRACYVCSGKH